MHVPFGVRGQAAEYIPSMNMYSASAVCVRGIVLGAGMQNSVQPSFCSRGVYILVGRDH